MQCSVIIPCHGGSALTRACIHSLLAQEGEHELEILVVDNGSSDDTRWLGEVDPRVRVVLLDENLGFAGGVNAGLRTARHPFLLVINNDTQAAPDLLVLLHAALVREPGVGFVAPVSNHVKGAALLPLGNAGASDAGRREIAAELRRAAAGLVQDVDYLSGLCLMFHRQTLALVGGFDERFGNGNFEDDDLSLRARLHGLRLLIVRDAFLHHEGHATFKALGVDYRQQLQSRRAQYEAKWRDDPAGQAHLAAACGDLQRATVLAQEAQRRYPRWADADWILGRACADRGEPAAAATHLRAFLRACPRHGEAALLLAVQLVKLGENQASTALLARTLDTCFVRRDDLAGLHRRFGEVARERGRTGAAVDCFRMALDCDPQSGVLQLALGTALLEHHRHADAIAPLTAAAGNGQPLARTNLGICLLQLGRPVQALREFAEAARLLPGNELAQANLRNALAWARATASAATPA